MSPVLFDNV